MQNTISSHHAMIKLKYNLGMLNWTKINKENSCNEICEQRSMCSKRSCSKCYRRSRIAKRSGSSICRKPLVYISGNKNNLLILTLNTFILDGLRVFIANHSYIIFHLYFRMQKICSLFSNHYLEEISGAVCSLKNTSSSLWLCVLQI